VARAEGHRGACDLEGCLGLRWRRSEDIMTKRTVEAYANGVFGTPTFVWDGEIYFGADRLEVLAWRMGRPSIGP
jgi:hypothetical protein